MNFVIAPNVTKSYDVVKVIQLTRDSILASNPDATIRYALTPDLMWVVDRLKLVQSDVIHIQQFPLVHNKELFNTKYYSVHDNVIEPFEFPICGDYTYWVRAGSLILSELRPGTELTWFNGTYSVVGYDAVGSALLTSVANMIVNNRYYYQNLFGVAANEYSLMNVLQQSHAVLSGGRPTYCDLPVKVIDDKSRILAVNSDGVKYVTPQVLSDWVFDINIAYSGVVENTAYLSVGDLINVE